MFKDYGFLTNKPTYNKLWTVCADIFPEASEIMLSDLATHYLATDTLPNKQDTLKGVLKSLPDMACGFAERHTSVNSLNRDFETEDTTFENIEL